MNRPRVIRYLSGLSLILVAVVGIVIGRYAYLLQGQMPSKERIFRTSTGGTPHYGTIQYREKDARPAILAPTFVAAEQAKMVGGTMGIGVSVGGESRFYPLFIMQYHQIVNDTCGDTPIVCSC